MTKRDPNVQTNPRYATKQPEEPSVIEDTELDTELDEELEQEIQEAEAELAEVVVNEGKSNNQISAERNIARRLIETCLQEIRNIPRVYETLSEDEQDEVIHRVRMSCNQVVAEVVATVSAGASRSRAIAELVSISAKAKITDIKLQIKSTDNAIHDLLGARGEQVVIVMGSDPNDYGVNRDGIRPDADQPSLL